jgi:HlyD family secretion protein
MNDAKSINSMRTFRFNLNLTHCPAFSTCIGLLIPIAFSFVSCNGIPQKADAYGNFETTEVMVMSETSGQLLECRISEGDYLDSGSVIGIVDTTMLHLQKAQYLARIHAVLTQRPSLQSQEAVFNEQLLTTEREIERTQKLLKDGAATQKQLDDLTSARIVLLKQKEAISAQQTTVAAETEVLYTQLDQVNEQIKRSKIRMPVSGHVLIKYAEKGELVNAGRSICKVGDLHTMVLRAYVSGNQLTEISVGKKVMIRVDGPDDSHKEYIGRVDWVSPSAEFTPKIVQTREERVNLVYAIKVSVLNDESLKIGMPGEVFFIHD